MRSSEPVVVIGELAIEKPVGTVKATDETDPPPVPAPMAVRNVEASRVEMVLSALIRVKVMALGFVRVKKFEPTVVAPKLVRAAAAVVAPVPPLARARAWVSVRLLAVVVPRVVVPVTPSVVATATDPVKFAALEIV